MRDYGILTDKIAIPFWIILIIYSIYEVRKGDFGALIVLVVILGALIIDSTLVTIDIIKNKKKK